ncbi:MAG TPA: carboxypeptidase-like regulatory domain-containing protein [Acidimicrobiales bacterium]|nr:carboxypeptidase-like regulatory domain-containing protein [Acidimicrobiales bacterium]
MLTAVPAGALPNTSITGTVTDLAGATPLANICVFAGSTDGGGGSNAVTSSDGTYSLNNLEPGTYNVFFYSQVGPNCGGTGGDFAQQWYNGSPFTGTNASVGLAVTSPATGIDAHMAVGADISGTVTAAVGGANLQNICVFATATSGVAYGTVTTASDGTYDVSGLPAGSYTVDFYFSSTCNGGSFAVTNEDYAQQWYSTTSPGTIVIGNATAVPLTTGQQQGSIDASMLEGAIIDGTVTNSSAADLGGVCVHAYGSNGFDGTATTASDGTFTITGLPADNYQFEWDPTCNFTINTPYEDVVTAPANDVALAAGSTTDESFALLDAGVIAGTITSEQTSGDLAGVCVTVDQTGNGVDHATATTASDGTYTIGNLAVGSFTVKVDPTCGATISSQYEIDNVTNPATTTSGATTTVDAALTASPGTLANVISPSTNPGTGVVGGTYATSATATSGDTVAITLDGSSSGCTISSRLVSFTGVGTCLVDFNDTTSGSNPYMSATQVQQSISISAAGGGGGGGGGGVVTTTTTTTAPPTTTTTTTTTTPPPAVKPQPVTLGFGSNSASLNSNEKNALGALVKKLKAGASITITAYAKNSKLAKLRAETVAKFLESRKGLHVTIKWLTKAGVNKVSVVTRKQ